VEEVVDAEIEKKMYMFFIQLPFEVQNRGDKNCHIAGPENEFVGLLCHEVTS
jgi:hypothetical protein